MAKKQDIFKPESTSISQILFITSAGEVLIKKKYKFDVADGTVAKLGMKISDGSFSMAPLMELHGVHFYIIQRQQIYLVAASAHNLGAVHIIETLSKLYHLCKDCCGVINPEAVNANMILIYEILDEFMDFGIVQLSSVEKLRPYLQSDPVPVKADPQDETRQAGPFGLEQRLAPSAAASKSVIRSKADQEARKNEIFVDVIERISVIFAKDGKLLRCELYGQINLKSFLGGSPLVKLGLNEDIYMQTPGKPKAYGNQTLLDQCQFHDNVNLSEFDTARILQIMPQEGEFAAMTYKIDGQLPHALPLRMESFVRESARDLEVGLRITCDIPASSHAVKVNVTFPVPQQVGSISQRLRHPGDTAELQHSPKQVVWKVKRIDGKSESSALFKLINQGSSNMKPSEVGPIAVTFEISGYVCSGIKVKFLRVFDREHSYVPYRWIRYITVTDSYVFHTS